MVRLTQRRYVHSQLSLAEEKIASLSSVFSTIVLFCLFAHRHCGLGAYGFKWRIPLLLTEIIVKTSSSRLLYVQVVWVAIKPELVPSN